MGAKIVHLSVQKEQPTTYQTSLFNLYLEKKVKVH